MLAEDFDVLAQCRGNVDQVGVDVRRERVTAAETKAKENLYCQNFSRLY